MATTKKNIKRKLDSMWSLLVKRNANNKCEVCGSIGVLNSHHIIGRANLNLRWDLRNGVCLCVRHHKWGNQSAHENPIFFFNWLEKKRPQDLEYLKQNQNKIKKWTDQELLELYDDLLNMYKNT